MKCLVSRSSIWGSSLTLVIWAACSCAGDDAGSDGGMDADNATGGEGSGHMDASDAPEGGEGGRRSPRAGSGGSDGGEGEWVWDAGEGGMDAGGTGGEPQDSGMDAAEAGGADGSEDGAAGSAGSGGSGGSAGSGGDGEDAGEETGGSGGTGGQPANCSGKPGAPGLSQREVVVDGDTRTFQVHIPTSLNRNTPAPVVFIFHGFSMSGEIMIELTGFAALADDEGFVAVFPEGPPAAPWNVGENICGLGGWVAGTADDFAFVESILNDIEADQCLDRSHVFVTGFSMGGYFSNHIGCQRSDLVRAIAPHSGGTYLGACPGGPTPTLLIHGTGDALIDPDCGEEARNVWAARNGCSTRFRTVAVEGGHCEWHLDCPPDGQVVLCLFDDMCHGWAATGDGSCTNSAGGDMYEDATSLIWEFFKDQW